VTTSTAPLELARHKVTRPVPNEQIQLVAEHRRPDVSLRPTEGFDSKRIVQWMERKNSHKHGSTTQSPPIQLPRFIIPVAIYIIKTKFS